MTHNWSCPIHSGALSAHLWLLPLTLSAPVASPIDKDILMVQDSIFVNGNTHYPQK